MSSYLCEGHRCPHCKTLFDHVIPYGGNCVDMKKNLRCCDECLNESIRKKNALKDQGALTFGAGQ